MLTYNFENVNGPLYEFIYQSIKSDIISGILKPKDKLPSKRTFARNNGISTITIQNAYDQLISEGYIFTLPRKGYYVADIVQLNNSPVNAQISHNIKIPNQDKCYEVDLTDNSINPDNFPFSIWAKLSREVMSTQKDELMRATGTGGLYSLREAIADYLKAMRGMLVHPNQIIVGAGTEYLYGLLIQLLGNKKTYVLENPGYKKLEKIYKQHNIICKHADIDGSGITVDALKQSKASIAHICPNHHFPTGITMPASRRYEVLAWANSSKDRYIIEDDYDSEFRKNGKPIPTLFSMDTCDKVIYMNTFSKTLTPTIRISYMVLPVSLANLFYERLSFYACTVSNFEQLTLARFIKDGYLEKHINRMRLYYGRQRRRIIEIIQNSSLEKKCEIIDNDSGLHFLIRLNTSLSDEAVIDRLKKNGINISALTEYYFDSGMRESEHLFIVNYSNVPLERLRGLFTNNA